MNAGTISQWTAPWLYAGALLAVFNGALAADAPLPGPEAENKTVITADQMIVHTKGSPGTVTFESNVVVQDAQFQLRCQRLIALVDPKSRRIIRVDATGGVTLNQQNRVGRALRATYTPEDGKVVLEGDPRVESPEGVVSGKIITYYRDSDKIVVSGGTRMEFDADKPKQTPQPAP